MTLLYKPIGIVLGILSGIVVARPIFNQVWGIIDEEEPPEPTTRDTRWQKLMLAAAVQGMVYRIVRVFVDRQLAKGFSFLTGKWPGEKKPDKA
jgi:hypothetical protein